MDFATVSSTFSSYSPPILSQWASLRTALSLLSLSSAPALVRVTHVSIQSWLYAAGIVQHTARLLLRRNNIKIWIQASSDQFSSSFFSEGCVNWNVHWKTKKPHIKSMEPSLFSPSQFLTLFSLLCPPVPSGALVLPSFGHRYLPQLTLLLGSSPVFVPLYSSFSTCSLAPG